MQWSGVCGQTPTFQGSSVRVVADQAASFFNNCNTCGHVGSVVSANEDTGQIVLFLATGNSPLCTPANYPTLQSSCTPDADIGCFPPGKNRGEKCDVAGNPSVGNPINVGTGSKFQTELDYVDPRGFLSVSRHYNSNIATEGHLYENRGFGPGWTSNILKRLLPIPNATPPSVIVELADGRRETFALSGSVGVGQADSKVAVVKDAGGYTVSRRDDGSERFDLEGKLLTETDRFGRVKQYIYAPSGAFTVTDHLSRQLGVAFDAQGRISGITAPGGELYQYEYGGPSGPAGGTGLTGVTYPDSAKRTYHYGEAANTSGASQPNALTGITDENGARFATFQYDALGRAIATEHAGGADRSTVTFGAGGNVVTSVLGASRSYAFQTILGVVNVGSRSHPGGPGCAPSSETITYDANGNVSSLTDFNGNRTDYAYDLSRNLETSRTEGLAASGVPTPQTRTISTQWHASLRLPLGIAEPLRIATNAWDADGTQCGARGALCSKSMQATTDADGSQAFSATPAGSPRSWSYTYNASGDVLAVNGPRTDVLDVTTYTYYANNDPDIGKRGRVATITNAAGHVTSITAYNAHGQPLSIADPNGLVTTMTYDARQRLTARAVGGEVTAYEYDGVGQTKKVTLPDASFLSYSYDAARRLIGIQDNLGNRIAYTLDLAGNRTQEQVFDPLNALAQTRSRVFDNLSRLFRELGAQNQVTEYAHDNQSNVLTVNDPLNRTTTNQYDALNRLKQVTDPGTGVTLYGYNGLDALTQVTDPRGLVTGYAVDGLGNLAQQTSPDTGNTVNTYDVAGNLATQTDAKAQVTTYAYDALNRVTLITFHDASKQAYAYDLGTNGIGRLSSITETNPANAVTSLIAYAYDQKGRVTSETRTVAGVSYSLSYQYDSSGRLAGLTYPSGRTVAYGFDALGRVNQVTTTKNSQSLVVVQNVQYHPFGGAKSWTLGNGQIYSRAVDLDGRIASYTLGATNNTVTFDAASRITGIATNTYGYDNLDRLTSAILPSSNFAYSYDAVGNRLTKTVGANTDTYTYGTTSNRIATVTPFGSPLKTFTLDANGSTTNDAASTFVYDTRGRMVQSTNTSSLVTTYQVNALGQRIRKTNANEDRVFTYDTWGKLIAESDPGGTAKREFIYLGDIPVGVVQ